jgi:hypothetical protein
MTEAQQVPAAEIGEVAGEAHQRIFAVLCIARLTRGNVQAA